MVQKKPVGLVIAERVQEEQCGGKYDVATQTWSNRNYDLAAAKKHNEDM
jgi:hypothetical protein